MRRLLASLVIVGACCQSVLAQQVVTPAPTDRSKDRPQEARVLTHRRAGQLAWLDPANWEIRGCSTFSAEQIRGDLAVDPDVMLATHPAAPAGNLESLPALLRDKVMIGYQFKGFLEPQVQAARAKEDKKILIDIVEGKRYNRGPVEITGTRELNKDQVAALFAQSQPATLASRITSQGTLTPRARWIIGQPAASSSVDLALLRRAIQRHLSELGRPAAKFDVKIEPRNGLAQLTVKIEEEGPASIIDRIWVLGNQQNSMEQILDYLGIKSGTTWTLAERLRIEARLVEAARFRAFKVEYSNEESTLKIKLRESTLSPPLSQEFSPTEQALLKFGNWLSRFEQSGEDWVFSGTEGKQKFEVIVSAKHGGVFTFRQLNDDKKPAAGRSIVFSKETLGLYSEVHGRRWVGQMLPGALMFGCDFSVIKEDDKERGSVNFAVGALTSSQAVDNPASLRLSISAPPVAMVALANQLESHCTLADNVLTIDFSGDFELRQLKIDARTGKLLDSVTPQDATNEQRISLAPGAYSQRIKELETACNQQPNQFDAQRPVASALGWLLDEARSPDLAELELASPLALAVARKAVDQGLIEPIDKYLLQMPAKMSPLNFAIPYDRESRPALNSDLGVFAHWCWFACNDFFARGAWPWVLAREVMASYTGLDEWQREEFAEQLESPESGPLRCLATAIWLYFSDDFDQAQKFATRGMEQLRSEKFHDDVAEVLDERGLLGRCLLRLAEVVRDLDTATVSSIALTLPPAERTLLTNFYIELNLDKSRPIAQALPMALDRMWEMPIDPMNPVYAPTFAGKKFDPLGNSSPKPNDTGSTTPEKFKDGRSWKPSIRSVLECALDEFKDAARRMLAENQKDQDSRPPATARDVGPYDPAGGKK